MTAEAYPAIAGFRQVVRRVFAAGNSMAGAEMLYVALTQVIIAIAMQRQQSCREHQHGRHFMKAIAMVVNNPDITDAFGNAQRLHVRFYLNDLPDNCLRAAIFTTRGLIDRLLPLSA